ncbi:50S ribosomal protein L32 [bacterium DOLZORAL124_38_8]|nr:MAG: 50S ribosomal protein L32 [bacterium DOLZORAL124_38_8]
MSKKPVPSKKQAVSSTKSRHSKYALEKRTKMEKKYVLDTCPQTGETKLRHFASPSGNYKGKNVFTPKAVDKAVKTIEA